VVLEFITPFQAFLVENGHELQPRSFRLTGNVVRLADGSETPADDVDRLLEAFFAEQDGWQTPVETAADSLARAFRQGGHRVPDRHAAAASQRQAARPSEPAWPGLSDDRHRGGERAGGQALHGERA
jgi:hypothetical protein